MSKIFKVLSASISILKSNPPQWSIAAFGVASSSGWKNPRLEPHVYVKFPADGIQDFDFVADPPGGITTQVITPIAADYLWVDVPREAQGVRVHGAKGSVVALADGSKSFSLDELGEPATP